jgi:hypothetical protein
MRQVVCTLPEGADISVSAGEYRRSIVGGAVVDLDQIIAKAQPATKDTPARQAVTLEEALGHHVAEHFEPLEPEAVDGLQAVSDEE